MDATTEHLPTHVLTLPDRTYCVGCITQPGLLTMGDGASWPTHYGTVTEIPADVVIGRNKAGFVQLDGITLYCWSPEQPEAAHGGSLSASDRRYLPWLPAHEPLMPHTRSAAA